MGQLGTDDPNAPADAGKAAEALAAMGLKSAAAPGGDVTVAAPALAAHAEKPAVAGGRVTLATVWPCGEVILSPLEEDGKAVVITEQGTEVSEADANRARAEAMKSGLRLREL